MDTALKPIASSLNLLDALYTTHSEDKESGPVLLSFQSRVDRIRRNIKLFRQSSPSSDAQDNIERRIRDDFTALNGELEGICDKSGKSPIFVQLVAEARTADSMSAINDRLDSLERHLDGFGLMKDLKNSFHAQAEGLKQELHDISAKHAELEPELCPFLQQIEDGVAALVLEVRAGRSTTTDSLGTGSTPEFPDIVPDESLDKYEEAEIRVMKTLPDKLAKMSTLVSKSSLCLDDKKGIMERIDGLRDSWKIPLEDIHYQEVSIGRRTKFVKLGEGACSTVYKAKLQLRGANGQPEGGAVSVAAKELKIERAELLKFKADFLRELYLLKECSHPSILHTYGAFWPAEDCSEEEYFPPVIVTERMTHHLSAALDNQALQDLEQKRSVLIDIATALSHLHKRNVVHRDVKPENVLLRVVEGEVAGPAKLSDFGVSRKLHKTRLLSTYASTKGPSGTIIYMPPEVLQDPSRSISRRSWDVWSFGLLICAVAGRRDEFALNVTAFNAQQVARSGKLAVAAQNWAKSISDKDMQNAALQCLSGDWRKRVEMEEVEALLTPLDPRGAFRRGKNAYFRYIWDGDSSYGKQALNYFIYAWNNAEVNAAPWVALCQQNGLGGSWQDSLVAYQEGHLKGNTTCTYKLGWVYRQVKGLPSEKEEAFKLMLAASNAGSLAATFLVGDCLDVGFGVSKDGEAAEKMFVKFISSVDGYLESTELDEITRGDLLWLAGVCYDAGDGVEQNKSKALKYYRRAVDLGNTDALALLGVIYYNGNGVKADERKATAFFQKATDRGSLMGCTSFGMMYLSGTGGKGDREKAFQLLKKAADEGFGVAEFFVGKCYKHGVGVKKNLELAETFSSRAKGKPFVDSGLDKDWEELMQDMPSLRNWYRRLIYAVYSRKP